MNIRSATDEMNVLLEWAVPTSRPNPDFRPVRGKMHQHSTSSAALLAFPLGARLWPDLILNLTVAAKQ